MLGGNLGGPDTGQGAPGRDIGKQLHRSSVITLLQGAAALPDGLTGGLHAAHAGNGFAVQGDFCGGGEPGFTPVEGRNRLALCSFREQSQLQLLHRVTVIVTE